MTTSNLAARTSWHAVFTVLGHDGPKAVPGPARCPLCQAPELFIYQDTTLEGGWCYCSRCLFSGDALDLAAAAWHCPRQEAVWKIISDTNAAQLQADAEHPRRKAKTFWDQASAYAPQSGTVLSHSSMSLNLTDVPRGEWLQRGGRYLGVATRALMTSWLSPYRLNRLFPR